MTFAADPETLLVTLTNRKAIADSIEKLIDVMSPDCDLEDGADVSRLSARTYSALIRPALPTTARAISAITSPTATSTTSHGPILAPKAVTGARTSRKGLTGSTRLDGRMRDPRRTCHGASTKPNLVRPKR
jgi:hypothetical protein